jgi:hypothetical protein
MRGKWGRRERSNLSRLCTCVWEKYREFCTTNMYVHVYVNNACVCLCVCVCICMYVYVYKKNAL